MKIAVADTQNYQRAASTKPTILLTIDVEDWFQVENFKHYIPFSSWSSRELRVEKNTHRILDLLDSIKLDNPTNAANPKATFFILGYNAERLPHLVQEIDARGHEIASHGYYHELCRKQPVEDLKRDLNRSRGLLEDISGKPVYGYRAPSFSINYDILKMVKDSGYYYDSSYNSFILNKRYGQLELGANNGSNGILFQIDDGFYELPVSNLKIGRHVVPWAGGGYFRMIPFQLFRLGVQSIFKKYGAYLFYLHPWEVDPDQPKVKEAEILFRCRHYMNLSRAINKLSLFIKYFKECSFQTCHQYLMSHETNNIAAQK
jgi:polysaccharide deacetylase family protein (PEP-CTERM system associated)